MKTVKLPKGEKLINVVVFAPPGQMERVLVATSMGLYELDLMTLKPILFEIPDES